MIKLYYKKSKLLFLLLTSLLPLSPFAQSEKQVNLGRLNITTVEVSSVNGSRSAHDQYYGAARLFDDDSNIINGINYNYWLTDAGTGQHWVNIEFSKAVSIHKLNVLLPGKPNSTINENLEDPNQDWLNKDLPKEWPSAYIVEVTRLLDDVQESETYGSFNIKGNKNRHKFKEPLTHVKAIKFIFYSDNMIKVQEIQILGLVEKGKVPSTKKQPVVKTDVQEISKIGRTHLYGEVFVAIISGKTVPVVTKTKKGWEYEIVMDNQVVIHLKLNDEGKIISKSYKILKK